MKKFSICIIINLLITTISFSQDCKDCNILYCDGYGCDDGSSADGVMTSRKCGCGNSISGACAKVEINLMDHPLYDPSSPSALKFTTQESGNFSIYFSDEFCTVNNCLIPEIEVTSNTSFEVPAGDIVYLTICKNGGNAGRRDINFQYFPIQSSETGFCDDNLDNDLDGITDCEDNECTTSCDAVDSGVGGGLESNGRLASDLTIRNFHMIKQGKSLFIPGDLQEIRLRRNKAERNNNSFKDFNTYLPVTSLSEGLTITESTPYGIVDVTNGEEMYAIDASDEIGRVGTILMVTTDNIVYEHTKPICDRLLGNTLDKIYKKSFGNDSLIIYKISREGRVPEYATSFSVRDSKDEFIIENHWTLDQYPMDSYMNIQIWTSSESRLEQWVSEMLSHLQSIKSVSINSSDIPNSFVRKGWIENGKLTMVIQSNVQQGSIDIHGNYSRTEIEENTYEYHEKIQMDSLNLMTETLDVVDFCDLGLHLSTGKGVGDDLYFADGQWGIDDHTGNSQILDFTISPSEDDSKEGYPLKRDISLEANTSDQLSLYRSLHPRFKAVDISRCNALTFNASGKGTLEVTLVKNSINEWMHHYSTSVLLLDDDEEYILPFNQFKSTRHNEFLTSDDIVMVVFTLKNNNGRVQTVNINLKNVSFTNVKSMAVISTSSPEQLQAYPNPFSNTLEFNFESEIEEPFELILTNTQGHIVLNEKGRSNPGINKVILNTTALSDGMYFIQIHSIRGGSKTGKVFCKKF